MRKILVTSSSMFLALICLVFLATASGFSSNSKFSKSNQSVSAMTLSSDPDTDTDTDDEELARRDKRLKEVQCQYEVLEEVPGGGEEIVSKMGIGKVCVYERGYTCRKREEVACGPDNTITNRNYQVLNS